jgi:hypothetical protein
MDSEKPRSTGAFVMRMCAVLLLLLLVYPLSYGPANYFYFKAVKKNMMVLKQPGEKERMRKRAENFGKMYVPLLNAVEETPLRGVVYSYGEWWGRLGGSEYVRMRIGVKMMETMTEEGQ